MANIHHAGSLSGHNGTSTARTCTCKFPKTFMSNENNDDISGNGEINKILNTENLQMDNGLMYTRRHVCEPANNPNPWRQVVKIARPKTPPKNKSLWVVRQRQEGKNPHWSLFAAFNDDTDGPPGRVWQVNGDPDVGMHYAHGSPEQGIPIFLSASFADKLLVCDDLSQDWETKLDEIAHTIKPPGPPQTPQNEGTRQIDFNRGTCKTWVWQVLDELVAEGIVSGAVATKARNLQPVKPLK